VPPNETVEKPLVRKMFIKISHNRLKNCQNVAKMLCGTPKSRHFSAFLSHFSKIIFEKRLIRQSQRPALPAAGGTGLHLRNGRTQSQNQLILTERIPPSACMHCWAASRSLILLATSVRHQLSLTRKSADAYQLLLSILLEYCPDQEYL
jgi:hypothetical protein